MDWRIAALVLAVCTIALPLITVKLAPVDIDASGLTAYNSPLVVMQSAAVFSLMLRIKRKAGKLIENIDRCSFGIYLIHTQPLVWVQILGKRFAAFADNRALVCIPQILLAATAIYLICAVIDAVRVQLFRLLRIRDLSDWLQDRLTALWTRVTARIAI